MKRILACVSVSLFCAGASAVPIFNPDNGHYYDIVAAQGIAWPDANSAASASSFGGFGGYLVTITSAEEHAFVNTVIQKQGLGEMWAGGFQNPITELNSQAGWTWVHGEGTFPGVDSTSPYAVWNAGEPNDFYGTNPLEQYLGLNNGPGFNDEGNLGNIAGYVIEYDPSIRVPDAGSTAVMLTGGIALLGAFTRKLRK